MNSKMKTKKYSVMRRAALLTVVALGFVAIGVSCNQGREGDRCNPVAAANGEDECGSGLSCQQPTNCAENYCCPTDLSQATNGFCKSDPNYCPAPPADAGTD